VIPADPMIDFEVIVVSGLHGDAQTYVQAADLAAKDILRNFNIPVYVIPRTNWGLGFDFSDDVEIYLGGEKIEPPNEYSETQLVEWFKEKIIQKLFELNKAEPAETTISNKKLEMGEATLLL